MHQSTNFITFIKLNVCIKVECIALTSVQRSQSTCFKVTKRPSCSQKVQQSPKIKTSIKFNSCIKVELTARKSVCQIQITCIKVKKSPSLSQNVQKNPPNAHQSQTCIKLQTRLILSYSNLGASILWDAFIHT